MSFVKFNEFIKYNGTRIICNRINSIVVEKIFSFQKLSRALLF